MNDNSITLAAQKLASAIGQLPKLEIINLESSLIRTKGAIAIARAIVSHKNLQVKFSSSKIKPHSIIYLLRNCILDVMICIPKVHLK